MQSKSKRPLATRLDRAPLIRPVPSQRRPPPIDSNHNVVYLVTSVESADSHWTAKSLRRMVQPEFLLSLNLHILLIIAAALFLLPAEARKTIQLVGSPATEPVQFESVDISVELPAPDLDWETDLTEELASESPETQADTLAFPTALIVTDFGSTAIDEPMTSIGISERHRDRSSGQTREAPPAAKSIQQQVVKAGGKNGEVQFTLVWKSESDLDLHVINPVGDRIFYEAPFGSKNGVLDVDRNAKDNRLTRTPVENVRWLSGKPISGRYTVWIHLFQARGENSVDFELMAKTGEDFDFQQSQVSGADNLKVYRYYFFASDISENERAAQLKKLKELQDREEKIAGKQLREAIASPRPRQRLLAIAADYPHTDAAVQALQRVSGNQRK